MINTETCNRCGDDNHAWSTASPLWNFVMRGNDINGTPRYGDLVCVGCFWECAKEVGIVGTWTLKLTDEGVLRLTVEPEPPELIYVTPSGRVWDPVLNLWVG